MRIEQFISDQVADHVTGTLVLLHHDGSILDVSASAVECYCRSRDELLASTIRDIHASAEGDAIEDRFRDAAEHGIRLEADHRRGDGSSFPVEIHVTAVSAEGETALLASVIDITERRDERRILRESEERFSALFNEAPLGYQSLDEDGRIIEANLAWLEALGYARDEVIGRSFEEFLTPASVQAFRERFPEFKARGAMHSEYEMLSKDRGTRTIAFDGRIGHNPDGSFKRTHCILTDTTERSRAEAALRESEAKYRMITEHSSDVIWTLDPETRRFLYVSPSVEQLRGYTPEEVLAEPVDAALTPEAAEAVGRLIAEGIRAFRAGDEPSGRPYVKEVEQPRKDGSTVWTEVVVSFHLNEESNRLEVHGVTRDISERRRVEQALGVYAELLDASPTAITVHTPHGELLYANQKALEMHGYERGEFLGLNLHEIDVPEDAERIDDRVQQIHHGGGATFDVRHRRKDGTILPLAVCARVADWDGREVILSAATDTTESMRAERALRESRDMLFNLTAQVPGVVYQYQLRPDGSSCFPWSSSGMNDIYEVSPEDVREDATSAFGRIHPDDRTRVAAAIGESAQMLEPFHQEYRVVLPRQGMRWLGCDALPERTDDGGTLWYGIIVDITERKESARALVQSAERHRTILETAMDGYWLVDMDGYLLEVNQAYCEMSGYGEEELLHMSIFDLETTRTTEDIIGHLQRIRAEGEDRFETQHRRKDGALFDVEISVRYQPTAGGRFAAFLRDITESKLAADRLARSLASVIEVVGQVVETRDPYTAGHERRVAQLAMCIAEEMGMSARQIEEIRVSALIHDVGKISVPAEILSKPGKLSEIEFELIKGHAESGYNILASADMDSGITEMVYQHHERCDGSGYPRGLQEEELVDGAKVLMVADVVEAMVSHRPYRPGLGLDAALNEIERGAGTLYDSAVVLACLALFRERRFGFPDS